MLKLISFIFFNSLFANNYHFEYKYNSFKVSDLEKFITIKATNLDLRIEKLPCNKILIEEFLGKLNSELKTSESLKNDQTDIKINANSSTFYESARSLRGKFFLTLPKNFKNLSYESKISCPK